MDKIILRGLRFYGYHGVNPEEKQEGQWFEVDVIIWGDLAPAALSDELQDTLNYSRVYKLIKRIVEGPSLNLLETLTEHILKEVLQFPLARKANVLVKKPQAPLGGPITYAAVEMERCKDEG